MSTFDPNQFLTATTTEAATRRPPLTAGSDFIGTLGAPIARPVQGKKDPSKSYTFIDFPVAVDLTAAPAERERIGQDTVNLRYSVSLDITDGGAIDWAPGRNRGLGMLREATGLNQPGKAFSIAQLEGRMIRVKISHREYPEGSGEVVDQIASVAKP
jgi:hypothetical protein